MRQRRFVAALAVLVLVTAWGPGRASAGRWRVGTWKTAQTIQPFFYEPFAAGNEVRVFPFTNPADQKSALLAKSLDMCGTTLAHAIHAASRGEPVTVVAALCNKCSALVVRKDGPVRTVAGLRGRRIGYVPGTMHEILLRETLAGSGLDPVRDVSLVRVDFFDMGTALARGDIDAFLSGEPFPAMAVFRGYGEILAHPYYDAGVGTINAGMLVRTETVEQDPDLVAAMVLAHASATRSLVGDPGRWLKAAAAFGTPLEILELAAPNMEPAWDMDQGFVRRVAALGARMKALGVIEREPDYGRLVDLRFVVLARKALEPEDGG